MYQLIPDAPVPNCSAFFPLVSPGYKFLRGQGIGDLPGNPRATAELLARTCIPIQTTKHGRFYWKHKQIRRLAHLLTTETTCRGFLRYLF